MALLGEQTLKFDGTIVTDLTGTSALSAATGTVEAGMATAIQTVTPTGDMTITAPTDVGTPGQSTTFVITTTGTTSRTLTFGTGFTSTGTLATGTTAGKIFAITFRCTAVGAWIESATRTAAM